MKAKVILARCFDFITNWVLIPELLVILIVGFVFICSVSFELLGLKESWNEWYYGHFPAIIYTILFFVFVSAVWARYRTVKRNKASSSDKSKTE